MMELRIPVPRACSFTVATDSQVPAISPPLEYFVLERHDDGTVRHPTSGRMVAGDVYSRLSHKDRDYIHNWLRGLWD
jgi:hypothetical protein